MASDNYKLGVDDTVYKEGMSANRSELAEACAALRVRYKIPMKELAKAIGGKFASAWQYYETRVVGPYLDADIAQKIAPIVERYGGTANEVWSLVAPRVEQLPTVVDKNLPLLSEVAHAELTVPALSTMPRDVPVYGTAHGGQGGDFEMNGQVIDYARRPAGIAQSKTVFCVYVQGESMVPWRRPGDLVYLNPDRPARPGDYVVVELQGKRGEPAHALLKQLVSVTTKHLVLAQHNPVRNDIKVERSHVKRVIRVIDWMELLGV